MKPIWRSALFLLPLAVCFGLPALVMGLSGEFTSPETVIKRMEENGDVLHGAVYSDPKYYVKTRNLTRLHPQLLALGNSRVMGFRGECFLRGVKFFNAGGVAVQIEDFRYYLEQLPPEALPQTLLVAMEGLFFHPQWETKPKLELEGHLQYLDWHLRHYSSAPEVYRASWRTALMDTFEGKIAWGRLLGLRGLGTRIGLHAVCHEQGFRPDGSYLYGGLQLEIANPHHSDYQFAHTLRLIREGEGRFAWGDRVWEPGMQEFDRLLDFCQAHRIEVICYLPPHAHAVWSAIQELGDKYAYLRIMKQRLGEKLAARGWEFYDLSDFAALGAPDSEAIDGFHGSERTYLRMLIAMMEQGSRLNAMASLPHLREVLRDSPSISGFPITRE